MERFEVFTGKSLTVEKYLETWKLDNETFEVKDQLSKKTALDWFKFSDRSTIVLWDNEKDRLVGYITPFLPIIGKALLPTNILFYHKDQSFT